MVGRMGDNVEFIDNREVSDLGLSREEQQQLTKMSLSKIVNNLRSKLKDEEAKAQRMSLKLEQAVKDKEALRMKLDNMIREKKMGATPTSTRVAKKKVEINADFDFNQSRSKPDPVNKADPENDSPKKRLSFK